MTDKTADAAQRQNVDLPYKSSRATDIISIYLGILVIVVMFFGLGFFTPLDVVFIFALPVLYYLLNPAILPILASQRWRGDPQPFGLDLHGARLREVTKGDFRAIALLFRRYVLVPKDAVRVDPQGARLILAHELGHIRNNDVGMYQLVRLIYFSLAWVVVGVLIISVLLYAFGSVDFGSVDNTPVSAISALAPMVLYAVILTLWIRRSLHIREFNADAYAHALEGDAYLHLLQSWLRLEDLPSAYAWYHFRAQLNRAAQWLTHPPLRARILVLQHGADRRAWAAFSEGILVSTTLWITAILLISSSPVLTGERPVTTGNPVYPVSTWTVAVISAAFLFFPIVLAAVSLASQEIVLSSVRLKRRLSAYAVGLGIGSLVIAVVVYLGSAQLSAPLGAIILGMIGRAIEIIVAGTAACGFAYIVYRVFGYTGRHILLHGFMSGFGIIGTIVFWMSSGLSPSVILPQLGGY